jgi:DNA ligase-1
MASSASAGLVQLASQWEAGRSPRGFLVSEKFDGVRAVWDGQSLRFRSGRLIYAPGSFRSALPPQPLDGELWLARGQFDRLSGIVRQEQPDEAAWARLTYLIFDAPALPGCRRPSRSAWTMRRPCSEGSMR